jgi:hypothetical protein
MIRVDEGCWKLGNGLGLVKDSIWVKFRGRGLQVQVQ